MSDLPQPQAVNNAKISSGDHPHSPEHGKFLVPSPVPTRRNRTYSQSERALKGETHKGNVKEFCRSKGHGFIMSEDGKTNFFVHISDVEGEYVPKPGDDVTFKLIKIPPNYQKQQAVHVQITHLAPCLVCVEGEYVPKPGDDVTFKLIKIPPNYQKQQAVHVQITHLAPGVSHETWNSPNASPNMSPRT